ncbi:DET1- and DDB1-associated protein 1-like [Limulus polyphemus]|uniref:DET1- and DDB1-associated protein 1 n=1 Tax=Limulus polyphemus TaxID=6850 RepID=A0ABM1B0N0_LIMPO|nr:DET1- and DDB1-associated protein 1-like [Limulus polyphemus]
MSIAEFLKELPSHNESNFTKFQADTTSKTTVKRPAVYLPTKDHPSEQIITTEKTNILLRYLHQQWDRKNSTKKRDSSHTGSGTEDENTSRKRLRTDGASNSPS